MLGMFINTVPIRLRLAGSGADALVQAAEAAFRDPMPYEQTPLALSQRCSGVQFGTSLFSAMLNYRHSDSVAHGASHGVAMVGVHERSNYPLAALTAPIRASPCCGAPTLMLCAPPKVIDLKPMNCVATASMTWR
jgi:hypothetical protein